MAIFIASSFYGILGLLLLSGATVVSSIIALFFLAGAIGAYYKKTELLDLCLLILVVVSLTSLILIGPLDPDMRNEELEDFIQGTNGRIMITIILYVLCLVYFYCLNAIRKFSIKLFILTFIFFFLVTIMIIYLRV